MSSHQTLAFPSLFKKNLDEEKGISTGEWTITERLNNTAISSPFYLRSIQRRDPNACLFRDGEMEPM